MWIFMTIVGAVLIGGNVWRRRKKLANGDRYVDRRLAEIARKNSKRGE